MRSFVIAAALAVLSAPALAQTPDGEKPVDPYTVSDANAGASPMSDAAVFAAFNGLEGVKRIAAGTVDRSMADERIKDIFATTDAPRLKRTLAEQICYLLGGGCAYTGRDMKSVHKDMGVQARDFNLLVEHLQAAMDAERVPFRAQGRLLAKLAPMKRDIVER
jgi:hemoglobin